MMTGKESINRLNGRDCFLLIYTYKRVMESYVQKLKKLQFICM